MAGSCDESTPDGETPSSPYVAAKTASTAYGNMFHKLYGVPVVTLRVFMAYGPGQNEKKLIPYVVRSLLNGKPPKLASGKQQIDWVHIDDVVAGFMAAAKAPGLEGKTIDLGSGTLTTIQEVVEQAALIIGSKAEPMFGARPDRPLLPTPRSAKLEESAALLGWRPTVSLQEGLRRTVHWHRNQINSVFAAALALISLVESA
jgi:UDP-glucose 4-epimerase